MSHGKRRPTSGPRRPKPRVPAEQETRAPAPAKPRVEAKKPPRPAAVEIEEARAAAEFLKLEPALIQTKQGKTETLDSNCFKFDD